MNQTDGGGVETLLTQMTEELRRYLALNPLIVGIHSGGAWIAEHLHRRLDLAEALGTLDISFYRDDFTRIGINPKVKASNLPVNVDNRHILLIDDVLHTGRTCRAALNEIFAFGRPSSVVLAVLVERNGRELPIQADVVGQHLQLADHQHVKLSGPESLELKITETAR